MQYAIKETLKRIHSRWAFIKVHKRGDLRVSSFFAVNSGSYMEQLYISKRRNYYDHIFIIINLSTYSGSGIIYYRVTNFADNCRLIDILWNCEASVL